MRAGQIVVWALAALLAAACWVLWAQETETAEEVGGPEQDEDSVRIEADDLRREGDIYYLERRERPVVLAHKDIKLYCDKAVYNREQDTAHAEGNPKVQDPNTTITGDYIDADFGKEIAVISENVTVVTQRKKEKAETEEAGEEEAAADEDEEPKRLKDYWEKKTVITCDKIEYQYNEDVKIATATSRVKAVQEDKTAYADKAVYEELKDIITLTGDVRVTTDKGDEFRSPHVVISVEEDWIQAKDAVGLTIRRDKEEEKQEAPAE
jgi:lipopolysaccharide assembly outer membrane protein LptD (OstA)